MPPSHDPSSSMPDSSMNREGCVKFDFITFWVSNAKQAASYFISYFGFTPLAYQGLETGSRQFAKHAVHQGDVIFVFVSCLTPENDEFYTHLRLHGDFVKDIAFTVDDLDGVLDNCLTHGAVIDKPLWSEEDASGIVRFATVKTTGDVTHTFVERKNYSGLFLPGFSSSASLLKPTLFPSLEYFSFIDHCVATRYEKTIESSQDFYEKSLSFHRFWSVDDSTGVNVETSQSSLKFLVVANNNESIKMTILEPGPVVAGKKKSQVQEFNEYNSGPGIQHIALHTHDIINCVKSLRERGLQFLTVPDNYYETLRQRLQSSPVVIQEDLHQLQEQQILLDYDDSGYLLQIFTKPMQDRPTLFLEIIQRHNHNGFGAGNFTALFRAVEKEQELRGNLK